eukprot:Platyproteum_vivax@DN6863_c0_g1_i2.p1
MLGYVYLLVTIFAMAEMNSERQYVSRTGDVWQSVNNKWVSVPASSMKTSKVLALPCRAFSFKFDGDFKVKDSAVFLPHETDPGRGKDANTGWTVWDGCVLLSHTLEFVQERIEGKRVLELGAGKGLAGLSAALLGASYVALSDQPYCQSQLQASIQLNGLRSAEAWVLDWNRPKESILSLYKFDVILAADVVWLENLVKPLASTISHFFNGSDPPPLVLMAIQTRSLATDSAFSAALATHSLRLKPFNVANPRWRALQDRIVVLKVYEVVALASTPCTQCTE